MRFHRHEVPSAGTREGAACRNAPNTTSGSICPITWREATGAGFAAFRMQPSGADTVSGARLPALFGTREATTQPSPNAV